MSPNRNKSEETYIWITRWPEFQHYRAERDRAPAWIKTYTKQHDDQVYLDLTTVQRGVLHDLRIAFAKSHGRLTRDTRKLCHRLNARVTARTLERLNHAGFIEFVSRDVLEQRLEELYGSSRVPRARPRAREEVEVEVEDPLTPARGGGDSNSDNGDTPDDELVQCKVCGEAVRRGAPCWNCGASPRRAGTNPRASAPPPRTSAETRLLAAEWWVRNVGFREDAGTVERELHDRKLADAEIEPLLALAASLHESSGEE